SSCSVYVHFSGGGEADWPESSSDHPNCVRESALSAPTPDGPMAAATAACARRQALRDADTAARPLPVTETTRERASSPGLILIHAADSIRARLRDSVVRSMLSLSANPPIVSGPASISITKIVN